MKTKIAFIGAGRMAGAMVHGILRTGYCRPREIICTSAPDGTAEALAADTGIRSTYDLEELLAEAEWLVLACKPQQLADLPDKLAEWTVGRRVLSILAGTTLARLKTRFPGAANIVRSMPNTPGMIGGGITAFSPAKPLDSVEEKEVRQILSALGDVIPMQESALNAVTGLSGSGPAYVFEFISALRDGGVAAGLDPETSYKLALKTVQGACFLLEAVPGSPETHRDWVSSPGGTTLAGLAVMEQAGFREVIKQTVLAATHRAGELSGS